jgi:hypothetical protein
LLLAVAAFYSVFVRVAIAGLFAFILVLLVGIFLWTRINRRFKELRGPWGTVNVSGFRANLLARALLNAVSSGNAERVRTVLGELVFVPRPGSLYSDLHETRTTGAELATTCILWALDTHNYSVLAALLDRYFLMVDHPLRYSIRHHMRGKRTLQDRARDTGDLQIMAGL